MEQERIIDYGSGRNVPCSHVHEFRLDMTAPVLDTIPPIYTFRCACGAWKQSQTVESD